MARYGEQGGDISESLARMQQVSAQQQEIDAKEKRYQETQERSGELARANARARRDVGRATTEVSDSFKSSQDMLAADTEAWRANTVVLRENLGLREQIRQLGGAAAPVPVSAPAAATRPTPVAATRAPRVPAAPSIVATGDLESARAAERAALARAEQARVDVAEARRTKAAPEDIASLRQAGTLASAEARAARSNITALEREAAASEAAAVAAREKAAADEKAAVASRVKAEADYRAAQATQHYAPSGVGAAPPGGFGLGAVSTAEQSRLAEAQAQRLAVADAIRQRVEAAGRAVAAPVPLQLGPASAIPLGPATAQPYVPMPGGRVEAERQRLAQEAAQAGAPPGGRPPPPPPAPPGGTGGGGGQDDYNRKLRQQAASAEAASTSERTLQRDIQQSGAAYAASSSALSRHGALTTEFIQALARGDVTLREFSSQMVSTIGKFGGWLVAGAAIFGVIKMFEDLKSGALDTQEAIVNLGRFIPGLGGPAGGGKGQIGAAQDLLRNISTQFNVPISEVSESMQVVSRVFHNLADAGDATRAVLAASRLDQIPAAQSTQYLLGISQSLGFGGQPGGGKQLIGIMESLNELQSRGGARVSQTLPAYARAAPAALAGGVSQNTLETLVAMGITAGIQPGSVGNALARTLGGNIFKPQAQTLLSSYGFQPTGSSAEKEVRGLFEMISRRTQEGRPLSQRELREIATTISTPNLATRVILPILEQQAGTRGGAPSRRFETLSEQAAHPRSYQADLDATLSSITERFKAIGNGLQNFGSQLAAIGALTPINAVFDALQFLAQAFEKVATPVEEVVRVFDKLPGPVEEVVLLAGTIAAARRLYKSTFIGSTAEDFAGRLAGRDEFERSPRQVIRQRLADARNVLLPEEKAQQEAASREAFRASARYADAERSRAAFEAQSRGVGREGVAAAPLSDEGMLYEARYADYDKAVERTAAKRATAAEEAANASERVARREVDIGLMLDKTLTWEEKTALLAERGYVAAEAVVNIRETEQKVLADQVAALRGGRGGAVAGGTLAGATAAGAAAGVTTAAVVKEVTDPINMAKITGAVSNLPPGAVRVPRSGLAEHGPELAPLESPIVRNIRRARGELPPEPQSAIVRQVGQYTGGPLVSPEERASDLATAALVESQQRTLRPSASGAAALSNLRQSRAGQAVARQLSSVSDIVSRNAAAIPLAGLLGSQLIGNAVGGGIGSAISNIGDPAFTGAMISQMLGKGAIGPGLGAGLVLGGFQQGGAAGAVAGGIGGGLLGRAAPSLAMKAIAALAPADFIAPEIAVPVQVAAAVAGTALGAGASLLGGGKSPQDQVNEAAKKANRAISNQGIGGTVGEFSTQFDSSLQDAISGSGDAASKGSAFVQKSLEGLTAQIQLFGSASKEGKKAQADLAEVVSAATSEIGPDPAMAQQIISGVQTAGQQVVTRTTRLLKYADPSQALSIARRGIAQLDVSGTKDSGLRGDEVTERGIIARLQRQLAAARPGDEVVSRGAPTVRGSLGAPVTGTDNVAKLQQALANAKQNLANTSAELTQIDLMRREMTDQIAELEFQSSRRGEVTQVARAQARTGDPFQQQFLGAWEANRAVRDARRNPLLHGQARQDAIQQAETARQAAQQSLAQTIAGGIQAQGAVTAASIPSTNPLARATAALRTSTDAYNAIKRYMQHHAAANNPQLLAQYLAGMLSAQQGVADAANQQASDLISSQEQLAQAQAHGDPGLIAAAQRAQGVAMLGIARTQGQKNAARAMIISAEDAGVDATRQWADAQTGLAEARAHGDAGLIAAAELAGGQRDLGLSKNKLDRAAALTRIANAQTAGNEAARALADAQTQVAVAGDYGNTVAQANDAITGANRQLGTAQTGAERLAAQAGLLNAVNQREQAIADRFTEFAALAASETLDPVQAAKDLADGAQKALENTRGIDNITKARTNRNQLLQSYRSLKIDNREAEVNFEFQMSEISTGQAVSMLQGLLNLQGLTKAKRQELLQEIRRYQLGQESPIGAQGFDLAPGNVRLPTFYDVAHAVQGRRVASAINHNDSRRYNNTVTVYVNRAEDVGAVSDAIDRSLGSNVRQRIKMAGVR